MAGVQLELTLRDFAALADRTPEQLATTDWTEPLTEIAALIQSDIKENFAGSHDPDGNPWLPLAHARPRGGDKPLRDLGILMASATGQGPRSIKEIGRDSLVVGTNLDKAPLHQFGGTVRPVDARALAIPLTVEAVRAGRARDFPRDLFIWKKKGGHAFLAESGHGPGERLTLHYILLSEVTIPARPFVGIGEELGRQIDDVLSAFLQKKIL